MKFHAGLSAIAVFGVLGVATGSCSSTTAEGCLCGGGFRAAVVAVIDTQGVAVAGIDLLITRVSTQETIEFIQNSAPQGFYIIMSDDFVGTLEQTGEVIRVEGQKGTASFLQDFVFGTDECRCHITRVSGPDTVTIRDDGGASAPSQPVAMAAAGHETLAALPSASAKSVSRRSRAATDLSGGALESQKP